MSLKGKNYGLIVIDMAKEQLYPDGVPLPFLKNWNGFANILKLSKLFPKEKVFDSRIWISKDDHSSLHELYPNIGNAGSDGAKLVQQLKDLEGTFVKKIQYSAFFGSKLHELLQEQGVKVVLLTGINTEWCVFASALDAFYLGYEVWLIPDACETSSGPSGHAQGIADFQRFLGSLGKIDFEGKMLSKFLLEETAYNYSISELGPNTLIGTIGFGTSPRDLEP